MVSGAYTARTWMPVRSYQDLEVWQRAVELAIESYRVTRRLPGREMYGLTSQIQRAAVSIPANIAEGHGRASRGDYVRHLTIANGSLRELETHLVLVERLDYTGSTELERARTLASRVGQMLVALLQRLRK
jgi:four helix bundle protein